MFQATQVKIHRNEKAGKVVSICLFIYGIKNLAGYCY